MIDPAAELENLRRLSPDAKMSWEGDNPVILLPQFPFLSGTRKMRMDLLLCPAGHEGYTSRLFFERQLDRGNNWKQYGVAGRQWWACSWNGVPEEMNWPGMLCAHLRAVA